MGWFRQTTAWLLAALLALQTLAVAQTLGTLARKYADSPNAANQRELQSFAGRHTRDAQGALAYLLLGAKAAEAGSWSAAVVDLKKAKGRLPQLEDYVAYYLGWSLKENGQLAEAASELAATYGNTPVSPFRDRGVLLAADALAGSNQGTEALVLLRKEYGTLPQPAGDVALAKAYESAGDPVSAAVAWQHVYYSYPNDKEARDAAGALDRLRVDLGDKFPPAMAQAILTRAANLIRGKRFADAKKELEAAITSLGGADRDLARVRLGVVDYAARQNAGAYRYLQNLQVGSPDADAERLHYLVVLARRLDRESEVPGLLQELEQKYPQSPWRLEALLTGGNMHILRNEQEDATRWYAACADGFPKSPQAAYCHWKVTWARYLQRPPDAERVLREHIERYPQSDKAAAAMYFLGRLAEDKRDRAAAKAYYEAIDKRFPNHFYSMLAGERLSAPALQSATADPETRTYLENLDLPDRSRDVKFEPTPVTRQRIARFHLLSNAGMDSWADTELRFGARTDGQPHVIMLELARTFSGSTAESDALRALKVYVPRYLHIPLDAAPKEFWRIAFPLPYRDLLERYSKLTSLDPFLVAGLIRQESEFNPKAVSPARAIGLTQVVPSTGRSLSRQTGIRRFSTRMLYTPDVNLRLGTHYLGQLLESLDGNWEQTLASYNAGKSRVLRWQNWADFREPAEFIESIPITETRDYVQIVLRNANVYRLLYDAPTAGLPSKNGRNAR